MRDRYIAVRGERNDHFFNVKMYAAITVISALFPLIIDWMFIAAFANEAHWKNGLWQLCVLTIVMRLGPLLLSWSSLEAHYSAVWIFPIAVICAFGLQWLLSKKLIRIFAFTMSAASLAWRRRHEAADFFARVAANFNSTNSAWPHPSRNGK